MKKLIYLASPYSHPDSEIRELRFKAACYAAANLILQGYQVFSPIAHSHPIVTLIGPDAELDADLWMDFDFRMMRSCDVLVILCVDGWATSQGIAKEMVFAVANNIPIKYMSAGGEWL